jgi:hypothetical protein
MVCTRSQAKKADANRRKVGQAAKKKMEYFITLRFPGTKPSDLPTDAWRAAGLIFNVARDHDGVIVTMSEKHLLRMNEQGMMSRPK